MCKEQTLNRTQEERQQQQQQEEDWVHAHCNLRARRNNTIACTHLMWTHTSATYSAGVIQPCWMDKEQLACMSVFKEL